jgi:hypothetical protein
VVPFWALVREEIAQVATRLVRDILGREGLVRRRTLLEVHPEALARAVESGYDPLLGARALKRSLERNLAQPAAERLAVLPPGVPTLVRVDPGPAGLQVRVEPLEDATPARLAVEHLDHRDPAALAGGLRAAWTRLGQALAASLPEEFSSASGLDPRSLEASQLQEELGSLRGSLETLERWAEHPPSRRPRVAPRAPRGAPVPALRFARERLVVQDMLAALDVRAFLEELAARALPPLGEPEERARFLGRELALLEARLADLDHDLGETVVVRLRGFGDAEDAVQAQAEALRGLLLALGLWVSEVAPAREPRGARELRVRGAGARRLARLEAGTHLHVDAEGRFRVVDLQVLPPGGGEPGAGLGPVLRVHEARGTVLDLRTRRLFRGEGLPVVVHRQLVAELLPLPAEIPLVEEAP